MRAKSGVLLFLALGCGTVAALGVSQLMARKSGQSVTPLETQDILIALDEISYGAPLTAEMVKLEAWPKDKIPKGAITDLEGFEGVRTKTRIYQGEPILQAKLFAEGEEGSPALQIPKGFRVVAVKVSAQTAGGSLIVPQDRVDVIVFFKANNITGVPETTTRTILQDIRVFAVNQTHNSQNTADQEQVISAKTVSLLVTPAQVEMLSLAEELGTIRLSIRSPDDSEDVDVAGALMADVLNEHGKSDRTKEDGESEDRGFGEGLASFLGKQPQNSLSDTLLATGEVPKGWSMTLVRGHILEVVSFDENGDLPAESDAGNLPGSSQDQLQLQPVNESTQPGAEESAPALNKASSGTGLDLSTILNGLL